MVDFVGDNSLARPEQTTFEYLGEWGQAAKVRIRNKVVRIVV